MSGGIVAQTIPNTIVNQQQQQLIIPNFQTTRLIHPQPAISGQQQTQKLSTVQTTSQPVLPARPIAQIPMVTVNKTIQNPQPGNVMTVQQQASLLQQTGKTQAIKSQQPLVSQVQLQNSKGLSQVTFTINTQAAGQVRLNPVIQTNKMIPNRSPSTLLIRPPISRIPSTQGQLQMPAKLTQQSVAQPSFLVQSPINRLPSQGIKTHIIENPKKNQTTQFMILSQNKNLVPINTVVQQKEMSNIPTPVAEYNTVMTDPTKKIEMLPIEIKDQTLLDNCAILPINEKSLIPQVVTTGGNTDITVIDSGKNSAIVVNQLNEIKNAKEDTLNSNGSNECHIILDIKEKESTENIEIIENSVNEKTVSVNELDVSKVNVEICKEPADEIIKESMDDVKSNEQILDDTHITVENEMSTIKTENNVSSNDSTENSANIVKKEANEISMEIDEGNVKTENIDEEKKETSKDVADYEALTWKDGVGTLEGSDLKVIFELIFSGQAWYYCDYSNFSMVENTPFSPFLQK